MSAPAKSCSTQDVEFAERRDGYPALAAWMSCDLDDETFIFRRFSNLSARNLLHLQAQLVGLEQEIFDADAIARQGGALVSSMRWETMMRFSNDKDRPEHKRVQDLDRLKNLLKDYYEALLQRSHIARLEKPNGRMLATARDFVKGPAPENANAAAEPVIEGRAQAYLDTEVDLVALTKPAEEDYMSRLLHACWPFRRERHNGPRNRTMVYKSSSVNRAVSALSLVLAAVLLIGAIVHLYSVENPGAKLGFVAMYTILFASSVAFCTSARRVEVFAATAAYAAVLVVFVSGDLGGSKGQQCFVQLEGGVLRAVDCPP